MISLVVLALLVFLIVGIVFFWCARTISKKYNKSFLQLFLISFMGGFLLLSIIFLTAYWFLIANQSSTNEKLPSWAKSFPEIKRAYSYSLVTDVDKTKASVTDTVNITEVLVSRKNVDNSSLASNIFPKLIEDIKKEDIQQKEKFNIKQAAYLSSEEKENIIAKYQHPTPRKIRLRLRSSLAGTDPAFSFNVPLRKTREYVQEYTPDPCFLTDRSSFKCIQHKMKLN